MHVQWFEDGRDPGDTSVHKDLETDGIARTSNNGLPEGSGVIGEHLGVKRG